ncbi:hypothetical protein HDU97_001917 [Phlyctochytrium planicorne]|nr:hypothetical protein HDU97_001917 [Phlyctochytrium planicorne]
MTGLLTVASLILMMAHHGVWQFPQLHVFDGDACQKSGPIDRATRDSYLVGRLPWAKGAAAIGDSYAGMFDIRRYPDGWNPQDNVTDEAKASMFFWYFPAQKPKSKGPTPLIVWLQGGPGSSSMIGLFYEMGPLRVNDDLKIERNPDSWNGEYGMLFIDNPVGTGFSYVNPLDRFNVSNAPTSEWTPSDEKIPRYSMGYTENQAAVARDLITFFNHFYNMFPEQRASDLYITGESYAGKYVPYIASAILQYNAEASRMGGKMAAPIRRRTDEDVESSLSSAVLPKNVTSVIPLKGVAIGNGLTDPASQVITHAPHALALGLVSNKQAKAMSIEAALAYTYTKQGKWAEALESRARVFNIFGKSTGGINYYDVRKGDVANDWAKMEALLGSESVKCALNVPKWVQFSKDPSVYFHLALDVMKPAAHVVAELLEKKLPVLLYQGQFDFRDGVMSSSEWIEGLEWQGRKGYLDAERTVWKSGGHVAGYLTEFKNLRRVEVLLAGHLAPMDAGPATYDMIRSFVEFSKSKY